MVKFDDEYFENRNMPIVILLSRQNFLFSWTKIYQD